MNGWLIVLINILGVAAVVCLVYLLLWVIPGPNSLFRLPKSNLLLWSIITFAITLACITTGISFILASRDIILIILEIIITCIVAIAPAIMFIIIITLYRNSITYEEFPSTREPVRIISETDV